jgi:hypothetical protein
MRRESRSTKNRKTQKETELITGGGGGRTVDCGLITDFVVVGERLSLVSSTTFCFILFNL